MFAFPLSLVIDAFRQDEFELLPEGVDCFII